MARKRIVKTTSDATIEEVFPRFVTAKLAQGVSKSTIKTYHSHFFCISKHLDTTIPFNQFQSIQRLQVDRKKLQGGLLVFWITGVQSIPQFRLLGGQGCAVIGQNFVGGDVEDIADTQDSFCSHVDSSTLNICVCTIRQSGSLCHLCLRHAHALADC